MIRTLIILTVAAIVYLIEHKVLPKVFNTVYEAEYHLYKSIIVGWVIGVIEYYILNYLEV